MSGDCAGIATSRGGRPTPSHVAEVKTYGFLGLPILLAFAL